MPPFGDRNDRCAHKRSTRRSGPSRHRHGLLVSLLARATCSRGAPGVAKTWVAALLRRSARLDTSASISPGHDARRCHRLTSCTKRARVSSIPCRSGLHETSCSPTKINRTPPAEDAGALLERWRSVRSPQTASAPAARSVPRRRDVRTQRARRHLIHAESASWTDHEKLGRGDAGARCRGVRLASQRDGFSPRELRVGLSFPAEEIARTDRRFRESR